MRTIQSTGKFKKDFKKLDKKIQKNTFKVAQSLSNDIFDKSLNIKKLKGYPGLYRVVDIRDYRMIYHFDESNIFLLRILHRKDIYKINLTA